MQVFYIGGLRKRTVRRIGNWKVRRTTPRLKTPEQNNAAVLPVPKKTMEVLYGTALESLRRLAAVADEDISLAWGMKDDLKKLQLTMSTVKVVLLDVEKKQQENEQLRVWLKQFKDVFLNAKDVLGEFNCGLLRREVVKMNGSIGRKVRCFFSCSPLRCALVLVIKLRR